MSGFTLYKLPAGQALFREGGGGGRAVRRDLGREGDR